MEMPPPHQGSPPEEDAHSQTDEEQTILRTLEKLRDRLDPDKIDWGRAGTISVRGSRGRTGPSGHKLPPSVR